MLSDLGFTRVTPVLAKMSSEEEGTVSFMAPELLSTRFGLDKVVPSKEADVFALGMTTYQVLTSRRPFSQMREAWIIHAVISGERPTKPENARQIGMSDTVWDLLGECWREDRTERPNISGVLRRFCDITHESKTSDSKIEMAGPRFDFAGSGSVHFEGTPVQREWGGPPLERPYPIIH